MPLGFDRTGVSTTAFDLALAGYNPVEGRQFQQRTLERVAALPGVRAAAYANSLPLSIDQSRTTAYPEAGEHPFLRSGRCAHLPGVAPLLRGTRNEARERPGLHRRRHRPNDPQWRSSTRHSCGVSCKVAIRLDAASERKPRASCRWLVSWKTENTRI